MNKLSLKSALIPLSLIGISIALVFALKHQSLFLDAGATASRATLDAGQITTDRILSIDAEPGSWLTGGRDYQQSYYSPLNNINKNNVHKLGFAWQYDIDTTHGFEATPIVVDGVMFSSGPKGAVYALDAKTGSPLWNFEPQIDPEIMRKVCCGLVNRGVAVWEGKVYQWGFPLPKVS